MNDEESQERVRILKEGRRDLSYIVKGASCYCVGNRLREQGGLREKSRSVLELSRLVMKVAQSQVVVM